MNKASIVPDADHWIEWAAHNLALGVPVNEITLEMTRSGFSEFETARTVTDIQRSPLFRAARRIGGELKKRTSLTDVLIELEGQTHDFSVIPRVSNLSSTDFHREFYALNRPVIIVDVVRKWPAFSKWNLDHLSETYGNAIVTYQHGRSRIDHRDSFVDHTREATVSEYIDLIRDGGETNDYYLIAHDKILDRPEFGPLLGDVHFDERYFDGEKTQGRVFFWLGPKGSMTPMHRDLGNVFFAQIMGQKLVKMVPSKEMHRVYNEHGYHSEVDFENYSLDDYPLLRGAHIITEVIQPGELLFIPLGWWHFVKSLDVTVTVTGNNFRFKNSFAEIF